MEKPEYSVSGVNDELNLFKTFVKWYAAHAPIVTFWGALDKLVLERLAGFEVHRFSIRKLLLKEHEYQITHSECDQFVEYCEAIDFSDISWGMRVGRVGVVLARARDDVYVEDSDLCGDIRGLLEEMKRKKFFESYELMED